MAELIIVLVRIVYIIAICSHLDQKFISMECKDLSLPCYTALPDILIYAEYLTITVIYRANIQNRTTHMSGPISHFRLSILLRFVPYRC
jgi:hypothetical protein